MYNIFVLFIFRVLYGPKMYTIWEYLNINYTEALVSNYVLWSQMKFMQHSLAPTCWSKHRGLIVVHCVPDRVMGCCCSERGVAEWTNSRGAWSTFRKVSIVLIVVLLLLIIFIVNFKVLAHLPIATHQNCCWALHYTLDLPRVFLPDAYSYSSDREHLPVYQKAQSLISVVKSNLYFKFQIMWKIWWV
jgi:hypothetical protein